jgi:hypothetical protein
MSEQTPKSWQDLTKNLYSASTGKLLALYVLRFKDALSYGAFDPEPDPNLNRDTKPIIEEAERRDAEMAAAKELLGETTMALRDVIGYAEAYCRGVASMVDSQTRARHEIHLRKARAALGIMAPKPDADGSI